MEPNEKKFFLGLAICLVIALFWLGVLKVHNEMRMTEMYERQAVALEKLAARK